MGVPAADEIDVEGQHGVERQGPAEVLHQLGVKRSNFRGGHRSRVDAVRPAREVERRAHQGLVHRRVRVPVSSHASLLSEGLTQRLPQHDTHILRCMVVVHLGISPSLHGEIEAAMSREEGEHVVEEPHARRDLRLTDSVDVQPHPDLRLPGPAVYFRNARRGSIHDYAFYVNSQAGPDWIPICQTRHDDNMNVVLIGPQGAGKGTQGQRLASLTGAKHLATGDLVRAEIRAGTDLGRRIQEYNDRGELVPDEIMVEIMVEMVEPHLTAGGSWILDGFPRDDAQARALDALLEQTGTRLDRVIVLQAPDEALVKRLSGRRQSKATGKTYHLEYDPPPPSDPGPFVQRVDDTPEDIRRRLEIYHRETEPLMRYYAGRDLLTEVNADQPIDAVTEDIVRTLRGGR